MKQERRVWPVKIVAVGLSFLGFLPLLVAGQMSVKLKVSAEQANIREKPDIGSPMVEQLPEGTILEAQSKEGEWYLVKLNREDGSAVTGYIHESLVVVVPMEIAPEIRPAEEKPVIEPVEKKREPAKIEKVEEEKPVLTEEEKIEADKPVISGREETGAAKTRSSAAIGDRWKTIKQRLRLSFHLAGDYMSPGDINRGAVGLAEAYEATLGARMNGTIGGLHLALGGGAEVEYALADGFFAGFGMDFFRGRRGSLVDFSVGNIPETFQTRPALRAIPIKIGLTYYPLNDFYVKGSLEYIIARATYLYRYEKKDGWVERQGKADAGGLGAEIAVGGEWKYSPNLALFGEAGFRLARIQGFSGKDLLLDSKGNATEVEGTLYYYLVKFTAGTYFPRVFIREDMPTEAGVADPREATVNLTGFSLRVGVRIRL